MLGRWLWLGSRVASSRWRPTSGPGCHARYLSDCLTLLSTRHVIAVGSDQQLHAGVAHLIADYQPQPGDPTEGISHRHGGPVSNNCVYWSCLRLAEITPAW